MTDHERIWLEPSPGADEDYGRQWCQHNVWGDEATEYVHADLHATLSSELDRLREENRALVDIVQRAQAIVSTSTYPNWHASARAALSPDNSTQKKEG